MSTSTDDESNEVANAEFGNVSSGPEPEKDPSALKARVRMIYDIPVCVTAELGHRSISLKELLGFGPGSVIELERMAGKSIDLLVNGILIGKGDVVVVNENYGLRLTEIVGVAERLGSLAETE